MSGPPPRPTESNPALLARAAGVVSRTVEDGVVLLSPTAVYPVVLSDSAGMLWDELETPRTVPGVTQTLSARYAIAPEFISDDVETAVRELIALGLVEPA